MTAAVVIWDAFRGAFLGSAPSLVCLDTRDGVQVTWRLQCSCKMQLCSACAGAGLRCQECLGTCKVRDACTVAGQGGELVGASARKVTVPCSCHKRRREGPCRDDVGWSWGSHSCWGRKGKEMRREKGF